MQESQPPPPLPFGLRNNALHSLHSIHPIENIDSGKTLVAADGSTTAAGPPSDATGEGGLRIGGVFGLGKKLGSGSFGEIYWCYHVGTGEEWAVKIERADTKHPQLMYESKLLKHLQVYEIII